MRVHSLAAMAEARAAPATESGRAAAKRARGVARAETHAMVARLGAQPDVAFAHPNFLAHPARVPNDQLFPRQWHYDLIGLPRAWELEIGRESVVVAVVDTGIRSDHPDLRGTLAGGFDFISDPGRANDGDGIDRDPFDPGDRVGPSPGGSFHGTHVAGTIGAATENIEGVAGVTWRARVMPLRVLGVGGGTVFDIAQAIKFAVGAPNASGLVPDRRAAVINLSFTVLGEAPLLRDAVEQATAAGALVVTAAGNTASDGLVSPAAFENSVSVAAVDALGGIAPYSNFGPRIDLAAPGGSTRVDVNGDDFPDGVLSTLLPGERAYAYVQGTSMACAHVSGIAALLVAARPTLSPAALRQALEDTAQDRGAPGRDDRYGHGLVDPAGALRGITGVRAPASPVLALDTLTLGFAADRSVLAVRASNAGGGTLEVGATVADTDDGVAWLSARFDAATASVAVTVNRAGLAPGVYGGRVAVASNGGHERIRVTMVVQSIGPSDVGPLRVRLLDPATASVKAEVATDAALGYRYRFDGVAAGQYEIFAGTDRDQDGAICDLGELCGAFPSLGNPNVVTIVGGETLEGRDFALEVVATADDTLP
jgi:serine protease